MKQFDIKEYNKMCAEFLKWEHTSNDGFICIETYCHLDYNSYYSGTHSHLRFHTDWNWIMEVVEKIESTQRSKFSPYTHPAVEVSSLCCSIVFYGNYKQVVAEVIRPTKKEAVVQAVWEFLNWYQQQSKPQTT